MLPTSAVAAAVVGFDGRQRPKPWTRAVLSWSSCSLSTDPQGCHRSPRFGWVHHCSRARSRKEHKVEHFQAQGSPYVRDTQARLHLYEHKERSIKIFATQSGTVRLACAIGFVHWRHDSSIKIKNHAITDRCPAYTRSSHLFIHQVVKATNKLLFLEYVTSDDHSPPPPKDL